MLCASSIESMKSPSAFCVIKKKVKKIVTRTRQKIIHKTDDMHLLCHDLKGGGGYRDLLGVFL